MKTTYAALAFAAFATFSIAAQAADAPGGTVTTTTTAIPAAATEKCYGVAKAGKDQAIELPAGVCDKLANGSLTAPAANPMGMAPADKK